MSPKKQFVVFLGHVFMSNDARKPKQSLKAPKISGNSMFHSK